MCLFVCCAQGQAGANGDDGFQGARGPPGNPGVDGRDGLPGERGRPVSCFFYGISSSGYRARVCAMSSFYLILPPG